MARKNYGKDFEFRFKKDFKETFPKRFILRLKDDVSRMFGTGKNPCDFIAHPNKLFMLEVKCHYGNTFPFKNFSQYDTLLTYQDLEGVEIGLIIWFIEHDKIVYVPLEVVTQMMNDGEKSVNINKLKDYKVTQVPTVKKRVFLQGDYSFMAQPINK